MQNAHLAATSESTSILEKHGHKAVAVMRPFTLNNHGYTVDSIFSAVTTLRSIEQNPNQCDIFLTGFNWLNTYGLQTRACQIMGRFALGTQHTPLMQVELSAELAPC